jgi:hypothetical protein
MKIVNLNQLNQQQEIPKITYRPFKTYRDFIYLEKVASSLEQEWTEGIFEFSLESNEMVRIDVGPQVKDPFLFDMEIPFTLSDIEKMSKHNRIYYSLVSQMNDEIILSFYEIDLDTRKQLLVLSFSYGVSEFDYLGMELLSEGFFLFRLSDTSPQSGGAESVYLVDVSEQSYYLVKDSILCMTFGEKSVFESKKGRFLLIEECYLSEEEQFDLLTSHDLELAIDIPNGMTEDFVHQNSILLIDFDLFLNEVKSGKESLSYQTLDSIFMDGSIRLIGENQKSFYYRQRVYDFVLKSKNDFMSRMMMGHEVIVELNKNSLNTRVVAKERYPNRLVVNDHGLFQVIQKEDCIEIVSLIRHKTIVHYQKHPGLYDSEEFVELANEILMIQCQSKIHPLQEYIKLVDITNKNEIISIARDFFVLGDTIFTV